MVVNKENCDPKISIEINKNIFSISSIEKEKEKEKENNSEEENQKEKDAEEDLKKKEEKVVAKIQPNLKIKKLWDPTNINNDESKFLYFFNLYFYLFIFLFYLVNEYITKSKEIWHKDYLWSEEIALNNLRITNFSKEKAFELIREQSKEYFDNIKGK